MPTVDKRSLGRVPREVIKFDPRNSQYPLREALRIMATPKQLASPPVHKTWYLRRSQQVDQGNTPHCVAAASKHWELSRPVAASSGLTVDELYAEFKKLDGYPNEDGTDGHAALKFYQAQGRCTNYFWYDGDDEALDLWLLTVGTAIFGAYWTDSMFQTLPDGKIEVVGEMYAGHETLFNAFDKRTGRTGVVNSWGLNHFGINGRGYLEYEDRKKLLGYYGDACVMVQTS